MTSAIFSIDCVASYRPNSETHETAGRVKANISSDAYVALSPWENGYCESFNSKLRDELLAREIFYDLREAKALIEGWRYHYNTARPHSSLGYKPPAPEAILPAAFILPYYGGVAA